MEGTTSGASPLSGGLQRRLRRQGSLGMADGGGEHLRAGATRVHDTQPALIEQLKALRLKAGKKRALVQRY